MYTLNENLIKLHHCRKMSWKTIFTLLKMDPELHMFYSTSNKKLPLPIAKETMEDFHSTFIQEQISQYKHNGITAITYFDSRYPKLLKEIYQPPWVLYTKGDASLMNMPKKLAVVGSRLATNYSHQVIEKLMPDLVQNGIIIASGLAAGVDTLAHKATMANGGKTIAVIAGGLFQIYPKQNIPLAREMMKKHLIISEYPPLSKPMKWQFPMRNRIISGICNGTLVMEAKRKSGSLITANFALNEGRDVFAIPGSIFSPFSVGANELIKAGAKPVLSAEDILEEWHY
ncbi:DNA-processing protein DprA [Niallia nealsonii]|uniref:DNA-processing protein DprA n=1 Tax=Niallia nealsonii TaxID=115979 RepID=UPI0038B34DF3